LNRLITLTDSLTGRFGFGYDTLNRRTSLTKPNGVNTSYSYDSLSRLLNILHKTGLTTVDGASYIYDNAGNRTAKTNQLNGVTEQYVYDAIYQLKQISQGPTTTEGYAYDPVGNRLSSLNVPSYNYNSSNELTSTPNISYTYDSNGNTLSKTVSGTITQYTWDFENRLSSVILPGSGGTATFKYDPFGRRIQKSSPSGTMNYLYDGVNIVEDLNSIGTLVARYTQNQGVDELLAQVRSGTTSYYEHDGLGSVTSLSASTGTLVNTYIYDSFGNLSNSTGTVANAFQYTGRDYDPETGLRYYRARYYDSQIGRFLSEDPIGFEAGVNFYSYVRSSPIGLRDPSGMNAGTAVLPALGGTVTTICFGTGICETVIVVSGTVIIVGGVMYMLANAKPMHPYQKDWRKQPEFQCGNRCGPILEEIYRFMEIIKVRYYDMMTDPGNLFNTAYSTKDPFRPWMGTWLGHEMALINAQRGLSNLIGEAAALGCPVPPEAYALAILPPPTTPGWKGFKP
jgi:RHS repeat-associated protein